jgi:hypothetical protein
MTIIPAIPLIKFFFLLIITSFFIQPLLLYAIDTHIMHVNCSLSLLFLGIGAESIVFASALSQRASLFKKTSFLMRNHPTHFNDVIRKCFLGNYTQQNLSFHTTLTLLNFTVFDFSAFFYFTPHCFYSQHCVLYNMQWRIYILSFNRDTFLHLPTNDNIQHRTKTMLTLFLFLL